MCAKTGEKRVPNNLNKSEVSLRMTLMNLRLVSTGTKCDLDRMTKIVSS